MMWEILTPKVWAFAFTTSSLFALAPAQAKDSFSIPELLNGKEISRAECDAMPSAVWITADGSSECLTYFISKLAGKEAVVLLNGDLVLNDPQTSKLSPDPAYVRATIGGEKKYAASEKAWFRRTFIELARPGTMGSSGKELAVRHRVHEARLISAALDALSTKEGIARFHLVGNSGGAMLIGALLALRTDIGCAVLGSGRLSISEDRDKGKPLSKELPTGLLDDKNYVDEVRADLRRRVFVLTDPLDKLSPNDGQTRFVMRAQNAGVNVVQMISTSIVEGDEHHDLQRQAQEVLKLCIEGAPDSRISKTVQKYSNLNKAAWVTANRSSPSPRVNIAPAQIPVAAVCGDLRAKITRSERSGSYEALSFTFEQQRKKLGDGGGAKSAEIIDDAMSLAKSMLKTARESVHVYDEARQARCLSSFDDWSYEQSKARLAEAQKALTWVEAYH